MAHLADPPFASGLFAKRATQTARQDSARRVGTRNGVPSALRLPNECLASYIEYDLPRPTIELTPNLSHFRAHLANPAIHEHLFRGSLGYFVMRCAWSYAVVIRVRFDSSEELEELDNKKETLWKTILSG